MEERAEDGAEPAVLAEIGALGRRDVFLLLATTLVIATNGIVYELLIAGYSSYLLGDSIYQFSLTIGLYLSAMGLGSFVTRRMTRGLLRKFLWLELAIALAGGASVLVLSLAFAFTRNYALVMFAWTLLIGFCIGIEIPLVTRLIAGGGPLRTVIANVLSFDYLGALVGSLAFPLFLLPTLGFMRTALAVGLLNLAVAGVGLIAFRRRLRRTWLLAGAMVVVAAALGGALVFAEALQARIQEGSARAEAMQAARAPADRAR